MTKATETVFFLAIITGIWSALHHGFIPVPEIVKTQIVPVLPWWALVSTGAYTLFTLGFDVFAFNDKPEKYTELMQQIDLAKTDLLSHGIEI